MLPRIERSGCRWFCTFVIGACFFASGIYGVIAQPTARGIYSHGSSGVMLILLGCAICASSVLGLLRHWGQLISTFLMTAFIGIVLLPATNSRRLDAILAASVLGLALLVAIVVDLLASSGTQIHNKKADRLGGSEDQQ